MKLEFKMKDTDPSDKELQALYKLMSKGHHEAVLTRTDSLLLAFPSSTKLQNIRGYSYSGLEQFDLAIDSYQKSLRLVQEQPAAYINLGVTLGKKGMLDASIECYDKALSLNPTHPEAFFNKGLTLAEHGKLEDAVPFFEQAVKENPEHLQAWINLGYIFLRTGNLENAKKCYEESLRLDRHSVSTFVNLAVVASAQGELQEAIVNYKEALKIDPNYAVAYNSLGIIFLQKKEFESALETFIKATEINPTFAEAYQNIGVVYKNMGKLDAALQSFDSALGINSDLVQAHFNKGIVLSAKGEIELSIDSYDQALQLSPSDPEIFYNRGVALNLKGDINSAMKCYQQALKINPEYAAAYYNLGVCFQDGGLLPEANESYKKSLEVDPKHSEVWNALGSIQAINLDFKRSEFSLNQAIELRPNFSDAYFNLGMNFQTQGRPREAFDLYKEGLRASGLCKNGNKEQKIFTLRHFGRSGTFFFHSLFDGHPEISTIPGVYLKGWFNADTWSNFAPDISDSGWRRVLANKLTKEYAPLFDSLNRKNVLGKPFMESPWLAKSSGFVEMGEDKETPFQLDDEKFKEKLIALLEDFDRLDEVSCFSLIHKAFDLAYREPEAMKNERVIFYHIHNPTPAEMLGVLEAYENCYPLFIVRNPVQSLESWILSDKELGKFDLGAWQSMVRKFGSMIAELSSPFNRNSWAIRLEDVKSEPRRVMSEVAEWMGIENDPSLYKSEFCGLKYWGPSSRTTGPISGFAHAAIKQPIGRLFSERDIKILETLFWPFANQFGYTDITKEDFLKRLEEFKPSLDTPLDFERQLYAELDNNELPIEQLLPYKTMRSELKNAWCILEKRETFPGLMQPLTTV